MADRSSVNKKDGKVFSVGNIEFPSVDFINPLYQLRIQKGAQIGETGLLKVFEIVPKTEDLPSFSGRWDQKSYLVDIDIHNVSKRLKYAFENGRCGFRGHHTEREHVNLGWRFRLSIAVPNNVFEKISEEPRIFDGTVWLRDLAREVEIFEEVKATSDFVTTSVVLQPGILRWFRRAIARFLARRSLKLSGGW